MTPDILLGYTFDVWIEFYKAIHEAEVNGEDCIIDTNAITEVHRAQFVEWFPTFEHHLIYISAESDLRKKNNLCRRRQVPDHVMDRMTAQLEVPWPKPNDGWKSITFIYNVDNKFTEPTVLKGDLQW